LIALTTLVWLYTHSRKEHIALSSIKMSAYSIILHFIFPIIVRYGHVPSPLLRIALVS
jgi:hypothetical protein